MKYLGSPTLRRTRARRRKINRNLAICAVLAGGVLVYNQFRAVDGPNASGDAQTSDQSTEITLPGQQSRIQTEPSVDARVARLPFEPLVPGRGAARSVADLEKVEHRNWVNVRVAPGDNLSLIFSRLKLSKSDLHEIASLPSAGSHLKRLKPKQLIRVQADGSKLVQLELELDDLNSIRIERSDAGFVGRIETIEPEIRVASATAQIRRSLFVDGQKAGLSDALIMRLIDIFGWDIDFALDIRDRDQFSVIYEEAYKDGELIKQGRILAAEFVNQGKTLRAVSFTDEKGRSQFYSDDGRAMRKAFLRTPVNFTRISSRFNLRRKHPVLNTIRAHRGVDYAAPRGTPVRATANGKIVSVGTNGGYGKTVKMQHGNAYSTLYAHLSRFPKGLKRGMSKKQGEIIGYVGKSGLATGPHLHYEFRVNGKHRNPLTVDLPEAQSIEKRYLAEFRAQAAPLLDQLTALNAQEEKLDPNILAEVDAEKLRP